jgi:hypothetical protein
MKFKYTRIAIALIAAVSLGLLLAGSGVFTSSVALADDDEQTSPVRRFSDNSVVGEAELKIDGNTVEVEFESVTTPGDAVTLWWVVFNNPEACNDNGCGSDDFGNADVEASVFWGTGTVVGVWGATVRNLTVYST